MFIPHQPEQEPPTSPHFFSYLLLFKEKKEKDNVQLLSKFSPWLLSVFLQCWWSSSAPANHHTSIWVPSPCILLFSYRCKCWCGTPFYFTENYLKTGHPLTEIPGAVGHVANGQWSSSVPHHFKFTLWLCSVKYIRTPMNAVPASNAADRT